MVLWFSRKNKSASRGGQAAQNTQSRKVYPPPSHGYDNASSSGNQAATSAIVRGPLDSSYQNNNHEAPHRQLAAESTLVNYSSPAPPSQAPPCDICAVWIKAFQNLPPDDFVLVRILVASLLLAAEKGCPVCRLIRDFYPRLAPYRDGVLKPGNVRVLIEQNKAADGRKESFECSILDDGDEYSKGRGTNIYCTKDLPCPWGLFPTETSAAHICTQPPLTDQVISGSGIDSCKKVAELWLHDCIRNHKCATDQDLQPLPTRVISIGETVHDLKLIETDHSPNRYICLSYCWGVNKSYDTTTKNRADRLCGIKYADMPKTYQDAVAMCHKLGIAFLWIDALCILQDSPDDFARESAQMADIYSRSFLTLAANRAANVHTSLFHSTFQPEARGTTAQGQPFRYLLAGSDVYVHFFGTWDDPAVFPLLDRGWVFQETLLAPRTLHFEQAELSWSCYAQRMCECNDAAGNIYKIRHGQALRDPMADGGMLAYQWRELAADYTSKALSHTTDKLPALSGLARQFQRRFQQRGENDTYLAGLWRSSLLDDMLWHVRPRGHVQPKPAVWRAPSWSWASNDSKIFYLQNFKNSGKLQLSTARPWVFVAECALAGADPTGQVTAGRVVLASTMVSGRLKLRKAGKQQFHDLHLPGVDGREDVYTTEDIPETVTGQRTSSRQVWLDHVQPNAPGSNRPRQSMEVQCFRLARFQYSGGLSITVNEPFLILEAVNKISTYQRIGIGSTVVQFWNTEQSAQQLVQEERPIENVGDLNAVAGEVEFTEAEKQAFWGSFRSSFEKGVGTEVVITIL